MPYLECPDAFPVQNGCSYTLPDYFGINGVDNDQPKWAEHKLIYSQSPQSQSSVLYGTSDVVFRVGGGSRLETNKKCTAKLSVIPPYHGTFEAQVPVLTYSSDASNVVGSYDTEYIGECDELQGGTCRIVDVKSKSASSFKWSKMSVPGSSTQTFTYSNGGQPWPENDVLTFTMSCQDSYGNPASRSIYTQPVVRVPVVTTTVPGASTTTTLKSTSVASATKLYTVNQATFTPVVTRFNATQTVFTSTTFTSTTTTKNSAVHTATAYRTVNATAVANATVTETNRANTVFVTPAGKTVTQTTTRVVIPTIISTCTRGAWTTKTTTISKTACPKTDAGITTIIPKRALPTPAPGMEERGYPETLAVGTSTSTFKAPNITRTITDTTGVRTVTLPVTTTIFDRVQTVTYTAEQNRTTTMISTVRAVQSAVKTVFANATTVTKPKTVTVATRTETTTARVTPKPVTITLPADEKKTQTSTVTKTSVNLSKAVRKPTTIWTSVATSTKCVVTSSAKP